jgi:hypothetical protein
MCGASHNQRFVKCACEPKKKGICKRCCQDCATRDRENVPNLSNSVTDYTNDDDDNMEQSTPWLQKLNWNASERTKEAISTCCRQLFTPSPGLELTSVQSATMDSPFASPDSSFVSPPLVTVFEDVITYSPAPFASPSPHLERLSCAMYRNSVPMGAKISTKVQGILCLFPENSVPFVTVDCDPSVHTISRIMYVRYPNSLDRTELLYYCVIGNNQIIRYIN